jgi:hypothetical protein
MDRNRIPHDPRHLGVPSGASKMISEPMVHSKQTVHLSCIKICTISKTDRIELPLEPFKLGVPSDASRTISEPTVHSEQNMHLSCTDTNTISQWTKTRFHMTNVTYEIHRMCSKWFSSLWYIWRKRGTFLVSRLALSPNKPNRASTWALSPRNTIRCIQNDF